MRSRRVAAGAPAATQPRISGQDVPSLWRRYPALVVRLGTADTRPRGDLWIYGIYNRPGRRRVCRRQALHLWEAAFVHFLLGVACEVVDHGKALVQDDEPGASAALDREVAAGGMGH